MNHFPIPTASETSDMADPNSSVPVLIGQVYETAPPSLRATMLEHLMRPLGILSLMAIADGVFASIRLRHGSIEPSVGLDEVVAVQSSDVVKLAAWVQQVSVEALDRLTHLLATSPVLTRSTATAVLLSLLIRVAKKQHNHMPWIESNRGQQRQ
jgi:hypothetical protein